VFGGSQKRPNLHIADMAGLYIHLLQLPEGRLAGDAFNAGYQNYSIAELAQMVRRVVEAEMPGKAPIEIVTSHTDDLRSYHVSSGKIADSLTDPRYFNVRIIKALCAAKPA
jgi:nucleoside-diphosphate-sugar epimerase